MAYSLGFYVLLQAGCIHDMRRGAASVWLAKCLRTLVTYLQTLVQVKKVSELARDFNNLAVSSVDVYSKTRPNPTDLIEPGCTMPTPTTSPPTALVSGCSRYLSSRKQFTST